MLNPLLLFDLLHPVLAEWDCYNKKCPIKMPWDDESYIDCDNRYWYCSDASSYLPCSLSDNISANARAGINCLNGEADCNWNSYTGVPFCNRVKYWDCYDKKCKSKSKSDSYNSNYNRNKYTTCDNKYDYCGSSAAGDNGVCRSDSDPGVNAKGVNCQRDSTESYCVSDAKTGVASCKQRQRWHCYDKKCRGIAPQLYSYVNCDMAKKYCSTLFSGKPKCLENPDYEAYRSGVNCIGGSKMCNWNEKTGAAFCIKPTYWQCYDVTKCTGKSELYQGPDQPLCDRGWSGVNCTRSQQCDLDENGAAFCKDKSNGNEIIIIVGGLVGVFFLVVCYCCCKKRCTENNHERIEGGREAQNVYVDITPASQPTAPPSENIELTTVHVAPPMYQPLQQEEGKYPDAPPPTYDECFEV